MVEEREHDGIVGRRVAQLVSESRDRPFFIAAGFRLPHSPRRAPQSFFDRYDLSRVPLAADHAMLTTGLPRIAFPPQVLTDLSADKKRDMIRSYYAVTSFMDSQLGVVLDALHRAGRWDDTVVVFFGDHGYHHFEHGGFWAKQSIMEDSARVPLIAAAPGKTAGAVATGLVELIDVFPTLTDLCGLCAPQGAEGASFSRLLDDPSGPGKPRVLTVVRRSAGRDEGLGYSVRTDRFTYTEWHDGSRQLYDSKADPYDRVNLAENSDHEATVADLSQALEQFHARRGG
ncbi:MAG: sulfatase-like hydrolase/transferase [Planctomycetes bacterium]|nr:sulfatase-like hydrolase/transferase [Planctomycetota bacterium]